MDVGSAVGELAAVASANRGVLQRAHLDAVGLTGRDIDAVIRRGELVRVHRDVYRLRGAGEARPEDVDFRAAVHAVRQRGRIVTGSAAIAVLGLPVFGHPKVIQVGLDERGGSSARSVFRTVARPPDHHLTLTADGRVACAARAALDAARLESVVAGVMAADAALARRMTTPEELDAVLCSMAGLRGVARARLCAELASGASESLGESWSAVVMHQHMVPRPERQVSIRDAEGLIGRADFWWQERRVVGEFDGRVKYGRVNPSGKPPEEVVWAEKIREDRLRAAGCRVIRWTASDLSAPRRWMDRLRGALAE